MKGNAVMAIKVNTTAAGVSGLLSTMYTTGSTATREVALSTTPGDFAVSARCLKAGLEVTSTSWQQQGTDRACQLPANSTAWINVRFSNCPSTSNCSFYSRATDRSDVVAKPPPLDRAGVSPLYHHLPIRKHSA